MAFIIDSSRSIWIYDFHRQLKFVQRLVESFDVGRNRTHVAALTFSHFVKHEFFFDEEQDPETIVKKVKLSKSFMERYAAKSPNILGG